MRLRLPKESAEEKTARSAAIEAANKYAAEIPLKSDGNIVQIVSAARSTWRKKEIRRRFRTLASGARDFAHVSEERR